MPGSLAPQRGAAFPFERRSAVDTRHLKLRQLVDADAGAVLSIFSDTGLARYEGIPPPHTLPQALSFIESGASTATRGRCFTWALEHRTSQSVIGICRIAFVECVEPAAQIAFILGRAHRGAGFMTEALDAVSRLLFHEVGLSRIEASADLANDDSCRLLARLGFCEDLSRREACVWMSERRTIGTFVLEQGASRKSHNFPVEAAD
jgi:ribosomal-protein-alanine N-acetyltransferase